MVRVSRLCRDPLISFRTDASLGCNINGPSVIRVPEWLHDGLGMYYMYFAHHEGRHIRLAYSNALTGPWTIYTPGVLSLTQTGFSRTSAEFQGVLYPPHIASPDVHVDHEARRFVMLFHGLNPDGTQSTRAAISDDGLQFTEVTGDLGPPYMRAIRWNGDVIAVAWAGEVLRASDIFGPYETGSSFLRNPLRNGLFSRHPVLCIHNGELHAFFTLIGDTPERIWHANVETRAGWSDWTLSEPVVVLSPELTWEGGKMPVQPSRIGTAHSCLRELRDPHLFGDYLFYAGGGESGIGLACIDWGN